MTKCIQIKRAMRQMIYGLLQSKYSLVKWEMWRLFGNVELAKWLSCHSRILPTCGIGHNCIAAVSYLHISIKNILRNFVLTAPDFLTTTAKKICVTFNVTLTWQYMILLKKKKFRLILLLKSWSFRMALRVHCYVCSIGRHCYKIIKWKLKS